MGTRKGGEINVICHKDHPHAYGDKSSSMSLEKSTDGSSPRVWGQGILDQCPLDIARIIPTRMGTSGLENPSGAITRDHPHAYGDKQ